MNLNKINENLYIICYTENGKLEDFLKLNDKHQLFVSYEHMDKICDILMNSEEVEYFGVWRMPEELLKLMITDFTLKTAIRWWSSNIAENKKYGKWICCYT